MAVANLHMPQPDQAERVALFSLDAIKAAQATLVDEEDPQQGCINIRVGFHTGSVVANVVGTKNPRCKWEWRWNSELPCNVPTLSSGLIRMTTG